MRPGEFCPQQQRVALGALGFSLKRVIGKIGSAVKKTVKGPEGIVRAIVAPITIGPTAIARGATWVAGRAGIPGAAKASDFMRRELDKQAAIVGAEAAIGAVVGGAILAAPAIGAAAATAGSALTTSGVAAGAAAIGKDTALDFAKGVIASKVGGGGGGPPPTSAPVEEVSTVGYGPPPAAQPELRVLKAGMFGGPNSFIAVGGAMALSLIVYALYNTSKRSSAAPAVPPDAPGPLAALSRRRRRRRRHQHTRR